MHNTYHIVICFKKEMKMINNKREFSATFVFFVIMAAIIYFLTDRYLFVEADVANSPLVLREFALHGISVLKDWTPTVDSWYFTIYPVHWVIFKIAGSDGLVPITIGTAIFSFAISVVAFLIARKYTNIMVAAISSLAITLLPAYTFTYGFAAHAFSHNSTNAFGVMAFIFALFSVHNRSITLMLASSFLCLLSSLSDPWFIASFYLPLIISVLILTYQDRKIAILSIPLIFGFAVYFSGFIQNYFSIPIHHIELIPVAEWAHNLWWSILIIGRMLNVFFIDNDLAYISSFLVAVAVSLLMLFKIKKFSLEIQFAVITL